MPSVDQLPSGRWRVQWRDASGRKRSAGRSFPTETAARTYGLDREADVRRGEDRDANAGRLLLRDWVAESGPPQLIGTRRLARLCSCRSTG